MVVLAGPTASGKSSLGLALATELGGEIVNYDSIQLYRHFDIGTAKPSRAERQQVGHHLVDVLDAETLFSAGDYQRLAREVIAGLVARGRLPVMVGGTGLYLRAVIDGLFPGPRRSVPLRQRLDRVAAERGREYPHRILSRIDPETARRVAPADLPKVIRAIEVRLVSGKPLSAHLEESPRNPAPSLRFVLAGLEPPREALREAIRVRVRAMYEAGLVREVRGILDRGVSPEAPAFRAIGYRQALAHIHGNMSLDEAIMLTERDTRRYAKRQMTWFRKQHVPVWFQGFGTDPEVRRRVGQFIGDAIRAGSSIPRRPLSTF